MPWDLKLIDEPKHIMLSYSGEVKSEEMDEALIAAISLTKESNIKKYLIDCVNMTAELSMIDLYNKVSKYDTEDVLRGMREAVLLPDVEIPMDGARFYENLCYNRGYIAKFFFQRDEAMNWLMKG